MRTPGETDSDTDRFYVKTIIATAWHGHSRPSSGLVYLDLDGGGGGGIITGVP